MSEFDKIIGYENEKEELARLCDTLKNRANAIYPILCCVQGGLGGRSMSKYPITMIP